MSDVDYRAFLPPPLRDLNWRPHPLDGKLLLDLVRLAPCLARD